VSYKQLKHPQPLNLLQHVYQLAIVQVIQVEHAV
jgi:hypothetical protein